MRFFMFIAVLAFAPAASAQSLSDLHWLKGCWRTNGQASEVTEVWLAPPMPALIGYAYTLRGGQVRVWEQTRIEMIDGRATFVAMPLGGDPVRFALRDGDGAQVARFDNPAHDYPQTVEYRREGDRLLGVISRIDGSDQSTFEYHRIACTPELAP